MAMIWTSLSRSCESVIIVLLATCGIAHCADFKVQRDARFEATPAFDRVIVDLGELPRGSSGRIELEVTNPSSEPLELGTYYGGCSCLKTTLSATTVSGGGTVTLTFQLTTPNRPKRIEQRAIVTIGRTRDLTGRSLIVVMNYRIANLIAFRDKMAIGNASEDDKELVFRLPLVVAETARTDIRGGRVHIASSDALVKLHSEVKRGDDGSCVECRIRTDEIPKNGVTGELSITNSATGLTDTVVCTLMIDPNLTIAPIPLRLVWSEEDGVFQSTALIRVREPRRKSSRPAQKQLESAGRISVSAQMANAEVKTATTQLAPGLARVRLSVVPSGDDADKFRKEEDPDGIF